MQVSLLLSLTTALVTILVSNSNAASFVQPPRNVQPKLDLSSLLKYLELFPRFGNSELTTEIVNLVIDLINLPDDVRPTLDRLLDESQDIFDPASLYTDFENDRNNFLSTFVEATENYLRGWLEDGQNIENYLAAYIKTIDPILPVFSDDLVRFQHNLVDYAHTFIPPSKFPELEEVINMTMIDVNRDSQRLHDLLVGPWPDPVDPPTPITTITLDVVEKFLEWIGELRAGQIYGQFFITRKALRKEYDNFALALHVILEAGEGKEFADAGAAILNNQLKFHDAQVRLFESVAKLLLRSWFDGDYLGALYRLEELDKATRSYFDKVPVEAVLNINKLSELVYGMEPEFVERAELLLEHTFTRVDSVVQEFKELFHWEDFPIS